MATPLIMPRFGMTQQVGTIVEWLVEEGSRVDKGDLILRVETDKVTMDVEAPEAGIVSGIRFPEGTEVPVTEVIAYLLAPGESLADQPGAGVTQSGVPASPLARRMAAEAAVDLGQLSAAAGGRKLWKADVQAYLEDAVEQVAPQAAAPAGEPGPVRATPAARRVARQQGVALEALAGSGPAGRIQESDVLAWIEAGRARVAQPATAATVPDAPALLSSPAGAARPAAAPAAAPIPLQGMRRTIARRMLHNYQSVPHINFTADVEMTRALALQDALQKSLGRRVSVTAILVRAVAWALTKHPALNVHVGDDHVQPFADANIGVAVALEEGLIVPVVHAAQTQGIGAIAAAVDDLAERARTGRLAPDDVSGGTFTISNLGMFGVDHFTAIINAPEAAILAVGRIARRFLPDDAGLPVAHPMMTLTLAVDHRAVDGAQAARFLADLKLALEEPYLLLA